MSVTLTITAPSVEDIAVIFNDLQQQSERPLEVDITGAELFIGIDLTPLEEPEPEEETPLEVDEPTAGDDQDGADVAEPDLEDPGAGDDEPTPAADGTCEAAIIKYLTEQDHVSWSASEIAAELPQFTQSTITVTLGRLAREDKIVRASRGKYTVAS